MQASSSRPSSSGGSGLPGDAPTSSGSDFGEGPPPARACSNSAAHASLQFACDRLLDADQVLHAEAAAPAHPQAALPAAAGGADDAAGGARPASAGVRSQDGLRLKLNVGAKARGGSTSAPPAAPGGLPLSDAPGQPRAQESSAPPASPQAAAELRPGIVADGAGSGPAPAALGTQAAKRAGTIGEAAGEAAPAAKRPRLGEPSAAEIAKVGGQLQLSATAATHVRSWQSACRLPLFPRCALAAADMHCGVAQVPAPNGHTALLCVSLDAAGRSLQVRLSLGGIADDRPCPKLRARSFTHCGNAVAGRQRRPRRCGAEGEASASCRAGRASAVRGAPLHAAAPCLDVAGCLGEIGYQVLMVLIVRRQMLPGWRLRRAGWLRQHRMRPPHAMRRSAALLSCARL